MVTTEGLLSQIKTLERQLAILKAQLKRLSPPTSAKTFADLRGILPSQPEFSTEEIDAALYPIRMD
jgi:hypothetical protein